MVAVQTTSSNVLKRGLIASGSALVINLVLYAVGSALGAFPPDARTPMGPPITWVSVTIMTLLGGVVGALGFLVMERMLGSSRARKLFVALSVLVLVVFFFAPFSIQNAPAAEIVVLEIMHLVVAGSLIYALVFRQP